MDGSLASDIPDATPHLRGRRVALMGKLAGMSHREAQELLRAAGAVPVERSDAQLDMLVLGERQSPLIEAVEQLEPAQRAAAESGRLQIVAETQLWQWLGLVEQEQGVHRLYTPAMLAELLEVPVAAIHRWHRRGWIMPAREVRRLPYFDFQEVATARRLAQLLAEGVSPAAIERQLAALSRWMPGVKRPLAQLSLIVEGQKLVMRRGNALVEPGGQLRLDFAAPAEEAEVPEQASPTLAFAEPIEYDEELESPTAHQLREQAHRLDEEGLLHEAINQLRAALVAEGPTPDSCFELAEMLYRAGDLTAARERYYMAIELDEDFVEARANLGCVLAELGQRELAVAAFEGALSYHPEYADARYLLDRTLDELGREAESEPQWQAFLALAPDSPWADTARQRLGLATEEAPLA